jgi:dipeptidyl aminopeptidase/acylaminoacyl peptidase
VTPGHDDPERALSRFIDYLAELPEVDASRIAMFGISMSGYWDTDWPRWPVLTA